MCTAAWLGQKCDCHGSKHVVTLRSSCLIEFDKKIVNRGLAVGHFVLSDHQAGERTPQSESRMRGVAAVSQSEIAQEEQEQEELVRRSRQKIITIASGFTFTSLPSPRCWRAKITRRAA